MSEIKAVIFDLDNTIGNRDAYAYSLFKHILVHSIEDIETNPLLLEAMLQDLLLWDAYGDSKKDEIFSKFEKKYKTRILFPEEVGTYWDNNLGNYYVNYEGVYELFDYLKPKYKLGLITNGPSFGQRLKINNSNLKAYFDCICISEEIRSAKPDRTIFNTCLDKLGVNPEEAIFIGDSFSIDIKGAIDAGMRAIWVRQDPYKPCEYPIKIIQNIRELYEFL